METRIRRPRTPMISKERKAELKRKGRLNLAEAAEYLEMATKTLYNRVSLARRKPEASAPKGVKGRNGWEFDVPELDAWDRQN